MSAFSRQENAVSEAFGAQAPKFDSITTSNPMEVLYRDIVRSHVLRFTKPGQRMLELNCGTGLDAFFFAGKGLHVHATDNSEGMLKQLSAKLDRSALKDRVTFEKCSYNSISVSSGDFDHVFSNFGGLNCTEDIEGVAMQLDAYVTVGGMVHVVLIAPVCLWEWMTFFKGKFKFAFRRLRRGGVASHLEGHYFTTYYFSPSRIRKAFGNTYETTQLRSLGCFLPPTFNDYFPARHPRLFRILKKTELALNTTWPFNRTGDLFIMSLRKK